jgi:hypothetical protein
MTKGDRVTVYEDPLTCSIVEEKNVELLNLLDVSERVCGSADVLEYWEVIFPDGSHAERWIRKDR